MSLTRPFRSLVSLAALGLLLQGCASAPERVAQPAGNTPLVAPAAAAPLPVVLTAAPVAQPSELDDLMSYLLVTRRLGPEQLTSVTRELRQLAAERNDIGTLKLALLLSDQPNSSEAEVMALLQPLFAEGSTTKPELRMFALLVFRDMQDRKRMKDSLASAQSKLKDAQRTQESSESKVAQMRRQIDELQNKIDAFKLMEQSILKRGR